MKILVAMFALAFCVVAIAPASNEVHAATIRIDPNGAP